MGEDFFLKRYLPKNYEFLVNFTRMGSILLVIGSGSILEMWVFEILYMIMIVIYIS